MKKITIVVLIVLVVLVGFYFIFTSQNKSIGESDMSTTIESSDDVLSWRADRDDFPLCTDTQTSDEDFGEAMVEAGFSDINYDPYTFPDIFTRAEIKLKCRIASSTPQKPNY